MRKLLFPGLFLAGLALLSPSCGKVGKKKSIPSPSDKVYTVSTSPVQSLSIPDVIELKGAFTSPQQVEIKSDFAGRVQTLSVIEGQNVFTGDALLKIDDEKLPLLLDRQRAELREAEAQQELDSRLAAGGGPLEEIPEEEEVVEEIPEAPAPGPEPGIPPPPAVDTELSPEAPPGEPASPLEAAPIAGQLMEEEAPAIGEEPRGIAALRNRTRAQRLAARRANATAPRPAVAQENPDVTESRLTLDQARVDRLRAEIALTERQLAGSTLSAPMDGFVNKVAVNEGASVKPDDLLLEIIQVDPIELTLKLPKEQIDKLEKSLEVKVTVPDLPGEAFKGEISFIGAELDADKKSIEVRIRVANPNLKIKVGMEGTAEIAVAKKTHQALLIPPDAILQKGENKFVYVAEGNVAEKQEVSTGTFFEGKVEVKSGLKENERVVTGGLSQLKEDEEFIKVSN